MDVLGVLNHPIEGLGTLAEILSERGFRVREELAENLKGNERFDVLVIMGGPMGVYEADQYPLRRDGADQESQEGGQEGPGRLPRVPVDIEVLRR